MHYLFYVKNVDDHRIKHLSLSGAEVRKSTNTTKKIENWDTPQDFYVGIVTGGRG